MARVLVVEDNRDAAEALAELLTLDGYDVSIAFDGQRALDVFDEVRPSLVVSDINMPLLDGLGLARALRLRAAGALVPLIAVSAMCRPHDVLESSAAGFNAHFCKPPDMDELEAVMAALLAGVSNSFDAS
jgi:DNA-binding response OmpR family regulator